MDAMEIAVAVVVVVGCVVFVLNAAPNRLRASAAQQRQHLLRGAATVAVGVFDLHRQLGKGVAEFGMNMTGSNPNHGCHAALA